MGKREKAKKRGKKGEDRYTCREQVHFEKESQIKSKRTPKTFVLGFEISRGPKSRS